MSETHFNLRRPQEPAADVESYIESGKAEPQSVEQMRRLVVQLPDSTHRRFKQLAIAQGTTMSDLCRAWVEEAACGAFWIGETTAGNVRKDAIDDERFYTS